MTLFCANGRTTTAAMPPPRPKTMFWERKDDKEEDDALRKELELWLVADRSDEGETKRILIKFGWF